MKYITIILVIVVGFLGYEVYKPELKYYPEGDVGKRTIYYTDLSIQTICSMCGEKSILYKVDSKKRIICNLCWQELK